MQQNIVLKLISIKHAWLYTSGDKHSLLACV